MDDELNPKNVDLSINFKFVVGFRNVSEKINELRKTDDLQYFYFFCYLFLFTFQSFSNTFRKTLRIFVWMKYIIERYLLWVGNSNQMNCTLGRIR